MSVIRLDQVRQSKQRQYMKRYRGRLDSFIQSRVPAESLPDLVAMMKDHHRITQDDPAVMWDYVDMRELILEFLETHIAAEIFEELKNQFWFDDRIITKEMVAERCLSFMVLGNEALAGQA